MSYTMLELVQQVTAELNLAVPTYVIGNQSQDVQQILALMNRAGYDLVKEHDWQSLELEYRFYTTAITTTCDTTEGTQILTAVGDVTGLDNNYSIVGTNIPQDTYVDEVLSSTSVSTSQESSSTSVGGTVTFSKTKYDLPTDFETITDNTHWDKTKHWQMLGPEDAQQWQWLKSGYISTGPRIRWRILGNQFQIWPPYNTQEYLGFEYRSKGWARSAAGVVKNSFTADSDTTVLDDTVMALATKLKYFQIKSFDTTALQADYFRYLNVAKANDKGSATLSFAPYPSKVLIGYANIPDTGYGS
tara:strand:+ start:682 stop:1587 length:906 start_codon:yes stop_codon:yes gene_type:complete